MILRVAVDSSQRLICPAAFNAEIVNGFGLQLGMILADGDLAEQLLSLGRAALRKNEESAIFQLGRRVSAEESFEDGNSALVSRIHQAVKRNQFEIFIRDSIWIWSLSHGLLDLLLQRR